MSTITIKKGSGISSFRYAYRYNGTRYPSSGTYNTASSSVTVTADYVWVSSITNSSSYSGWYDNQGNSGDSTDVNVTYYSSATIHGTYVETEYTYYYCYKLYIDGQYVRTSTNYSKTTTSSNGYNISLSTVQSVMGPGSGYTFDHADAEYNCDFDRGYFTVYAQSYSSMSICSVYYTTNTQTYTYHYCYKLYIDGQYVRTSTNYSVQSTVGSGYNIALSTVQSEMSPGAGYAFDRADAEYNCTFSQGYFTVQGQSYSAMSVCAVYYTTIQQYFSCSAAYGTGYSGRASVLTVNNGATAASTVQVLSGATATWSCTPATGYNFSGWYSNAACTSLVSSSATYSETITAARTLYAKLLPKTYSVSARKDGYNSCFTSVQVSSSVVAYNETVTFTATLANSYGFTFLGWYTNDGTRMSTSKTYSFTVTQAIILYARAAVKWTYSHAAGTSRISKEEWDRVQAFIHDRNGATFNHEATVGNPLSQGLYNDTVDGIGTGTIVERGDVITQSLLDEIVENANDL